MASAGVTGDNGIALQVEHLSIAYALPRLARRARCGEQRELSTWQPAAS